MPELALNSPDNATPTKSRRWMLIVLIVLTICGGTYWWQNRLTPDEQIFVGCWELISDSEGKKVVVKIVEFHSNRTADHNEVLFHWTANNGRLYVREISPVRERVAALFKYLLRGVQIDSDGDMTLYEIVDRDKIIFTYEEGPLKTTGIFQRIFEDQPQDIP